MCIRSSVAVFAAAEMLPRALSRHVRLGQHDRLGAPPRQEVAHLGQKQERVAVRLLLQALVLDQERHRVDAEPRHPQLQPVAHDLDDLGAHLGVGDVEVGLMRVEAVHVPRARLLGLGPDRVLHAGKDDPVGDVLAASRRTRRTSRDRGCPPSLRAERNHGWSTEVWLTTRSTITRSPWSSAAWVNSHEVAGAAQPRIDAVEVGDVVAVVAVGRGVERVQPDRADPQRLEVVQPVGQALEVARSRRRWRP